MKEELENKEFYEKLINTLENCSNILKLIKEGEDPFDDRYEKSIIYEQLVKYIHRGYIKGEI